MRRMALSRQTARSRISVGTSGHSCSVGRARPLLRRFDSEVTLHTAGDQPALEVEHVAFPGVVESLGLKGRDGHPSRAPTSSTSTAIRSNSSRSMVHMCWKRRPGARPADRVRAGHGQTRRRRDGRR